ncbi:Hypothetical predicted protein [Paramuricea clavata]|uniref:Uncharacterized protein n=1 Tax=Paramuricea clavata TaxID=317549 RepID=A0A7D9DLF1_PARCT|nr:Hypothetical predicted protein [Paramuricea clavata]
MSESIARTSDETELNMLIATMGTLIRSFYKLVALTATCTDSSLLRARIHNILFPDFVGSDFPGRDVFSDLERRRQPRIRNSAFKLDTYNRILMVLIWLRMYPEMSMLSALFMVSHSTMEREIRISETWLDMAHDWEHFPGALVLLME